MKLSGWVRLWIVLSAIYAIAVITVAANTVPQIDSVYMSWKYSVAEMTAKEFTKRYEREYTTYEILDLLEEKTKNNDPGMFQLFQRIEKNPKEGDEEFSKSIGKINKKYQGEIARHPTTVFVHWLWASVWLISGVLLMYLSGWSVGWVINGFRK